MNQRRIDADDKVQRHQQRGAIGEVLDIGASVAQNRREALRGNGFRICAKLQRMEGCPGNFEQGGQYRQRDRSVAVVAMGRFAGPGNADLAAFRRWMCGWHAGCGEIGNPGRDGFRRCFGQTGKRQQGHLRIMGGQGCRIADRNRDAIESRAGGKEACQRCRTFENYPVRCARARAHQRQVTDELDRVAESLFCVYQQRFTGQVPAVPGRRVKSARCGVGNLPAPVVFGEAAFDIALQQQCQRPVPFQFR